MDNFSGILLVNKSKGQTSFSIINILRKLLNVKKIGHAGTLDPFASGLMIILIGKDFTKKSENFINLKKEYIASVHLGYVTKTFDTESEKIKISEKIPSKKEVEEVLQKFQGKIKQIPPMYSAKKVNGQKLYNLARKGISIKREPIEVELFITLLSYEYPFIDLEIRCSKGTYIRTLADDIGKKLETGAFLQNLIRTKCGEFDLQNAIDQDKLYEKDFDPSILNLS